MRTRPLGAALRSRRSPGRFEPCRPLQVCPRSMMVVSRPRTPRVSVRFRPGARCARSSAGECWYDMPEIAGSIPAVRTVSSHLVSMSCSSSRPGGRALNPATRVRLPHTTPTVATQAAIRDRVGFQVRPAGFNSSAACHMASSSPGGEGSPTNCTRRVRSPGSPRKFR